MLCIQFGWEYVSVCCQLIAFSSLGWNTLLDAGVTVSADTVVVKATPSADRGFASSCRRRTDTPLDAVLVASRVIGAKRELDSSWKPGVALVHVWIANGTAVTLGIAVTEASL